MNMIKGLIKSRDILGHSLEICQSFGVYFYLRCLYHALVNPRSHSFLDLLKFRPR